MLDNISRVYLKQSGVKGSDYVNASYIDVSLQSHVLKCCMIHIVRLLAKFNCVECTLVCQ